MNCEGLWRLFLETGLPEAYLVLRVQEREEELTEARTAFAAEPSEKREC